MDRQTDRQTDKSDFILYCLTYVERPKDSQNETDIVEGQLVSTRILFYC